MTDSELDLTTIVEARDDNNEMIDNERPIENMPIGEVTTGKSKWGPKVHPIWSYAFDDPTAYSITSPNNTKCKHCKQSVRHHHKTASVKSHLRKCFQFKKVMLDTAVKDCPDWWTDQRGTGKKSIGSTSAKSSSSVTSKSQSSVIIYHIPVHCFRTKEVQT